MRELKFRAWIKDHTSLGIHEKARMTDTFSFDDFDGRYLISEGVYLEQMELMQFTGLLDDKGQEIWEGDIVRSGLIHHEIVFEFGSFRFKGATPTSMALGFTGRPAIEVIGNIYENPELIKKIS